jgi:hypothetical protein
MNAAVHTSSRVHRCRDDVPVPSAIYLTTQSGGRCHEGCSQQPFPVMGVLTFTARHPPVPTVSCDPPVRQSHHRCHLLPGAASRGPRSLLVVHNDGSGQPVAPVRTLGRLRVSRLTAPARPGLRTKVRRTTGTGQLITNRKSGRAVREQTPPRNGRPGPPPVRGMHAHSGSTQWSNTPDARSRPGTGVGVEPPPQPWQKSLARSTSATGTTTTSRATRIAARAAN